MGEEKLKQTQKQINKTFGFGFLKVITIDYK